MKPCMQKQVLALAGLCGVLSGGQAFGQYEPPSTYIDSLETMTASSEVIVRGKIVGVESEPIKYGDVATWNVVSLKTTEFLKGDKTDVKKFGVITANTNKALERWEKSQSEILCFLSGPTGAEIDLVRDKVSHVARRVGHQWMTMFELGSPDAKVEHGFVFNSELSLPKGNELLKEVRAACAAKLDRNAQVHHMQLPTPVAQRSGVAGYKAFLALARDERLEKLARRLVETPNEFLEKGQEDLAVKFRLEGVKALRLFPSEKNLAVLNKWRETNAKRDVAIPVESLLPQPADVVAMFVRLPENLAAVPEVHLQQPLSKAMKIDEAQLRTACTIDMIHFHNQKKTDGFVKALLMSKRSDLTGLPFIMGDACRMKEDEGRRFVAARAKLRNAFDQFSRQLQRGEYGNNKNRMELYEEIEARTCEKSDIQARTSTLMQMMGAEIVDDRLDLVKYMEGRGDLVATRALATLAIFSQEAEVRQAAVRALKLRLDGDYTDILMTGLNYPWPQVAERTTEAIVQLGRTDLLPQLIEVLDRPIRVLLRRQELNGKQTTVVRELVRINHHHNCLLCHAPATAERDKLSKEETAKLAPLTAQVPVPSEAMNAYYSPNQPDILVRFDVTYLRQDFSLNLPVAGAAPWPEMQRYDFLVRTRAVTEKEASEYNELLQSTTKDGSPYRRAAHAALRQLTGRDGEATAAAWRKVMRL